MAELKLHPQKTRSGSFSIEKHHYENVGMNERLISMLLGGVLIGSTLKNPFKSRLLYGAYLAYRGLTGKCFLYDYLGIDSKRPHAINVRGQFEIDLPPAEVYSYWRNLNNLPISLNQMLNVDIKDEKLSSWRANVFNNLFSLKWDAEIVKDEPNHLIGWRSAKGSAFRHVGRVEFEKIPDGSGTVLKIALSYHPPGGGVGQGVSKILTPVFEHLLQKEIKNFKYNIEHKTPMFI